MKLQSARLRLTGSATTLPHLIRIKVVAQWFFGAFW
jgi:hypothetical protein